MAIANHHTVTALQLLISQCMRQQFAFVLQTSIQFGSIDCTEILIQIEMLQDPLNKNSRLAGGHEQWMPAATQFQQHLSNLGVEFVLEQSNGGEALAVVLNGSISLILTNQLYKALAQWRPNAPSQLRLGWRDDLQLLHCKSNTARDALLGIG